MTDLSIIFLHWVEENGPVKETLLSLESVYRYTNIPFELIIVSNGSTDYMNNEIVKLISKIKKKYYAPTKVKFVNLDTNAGVSKGFNAGLKKISEDTKYISIYSNDWICSPYWAEIMTDALEDNPKLGFATACTNWGAGSMCFDSRNPNPTPKHFFDKDDERIFKAVEIIGERCQKSGDATSDNKFPAMGWTMKKEVFDKLGYMDENVFCANDVAYGVRGINLGYETRTIWGAYIYHFWHSSFSQINDRETYAYLKPKDKADSDYIKNSILYKEDYYLDENQKMFPL